MELPGRPVDYVLVLRQAIVDLWPYVEDNVTLGATLDSWLRLLVWLSTNYPDHWYLMDVIALLLSHARARPWVFEEVEHLCWLDIRAVEADLAAAFGSLDSMPSIPSLYELMHLYQGEGYLQEAMEVAAVARRLGIADPLCELVDGKQGVLTPEGLVQEETG